MNHQLAVLARIQSDLRGQPISPSEFEVTLKECISFLLDRLALYVSQIQASTTAVEECISVLRNLLAFCESQIQGSTPTTTAHTDLGVEPPRGTTAENAQRASAPGSAGRSNRKRRRSSQTQGRASPARPAMNPQSPTLPYPDPSSRNPEGHRSRPSAEEDLKKIEAEVRKVADVLKRGSSSRELHSSLPDVTLVAGPHPSGGLSTAEILCTAETEPLIAIMTSYQEPATQGKITDTGMRIQNALWKLGYIHCYKTIEKYLLHEFLSDRI